MFLRILLPLSYLLIFGWTAGATASTALNDAQRQSILDRLMPLPQEITLNEIATVPLSAIKLTVTGNEPIAARIRQELADNLKTSETVAPDAESFEILVGLPDGAGTIAGHTPAHLEALRKAPHSNQAYVIEPINGNGLLVSALDPKGLYYGAATLRQLLSAARRPAGEAWLIPLATIRDWPDLDERGVWNFPWPDQWIPWMASMKLNYGNMNAEIQKIESGKPNHAKLDLDNFRLANEIAFNYVPQIVHLNFLEDYGLFSAYPELAGKGDKALAGRYFAHKRGHQHRAPDAGNPLLTQILTEWMKDIAAQGAMDVACWLTERPAEDQRPSTTAVGQFVLEGRAYINAWRETRKTYPDFKIRMFVSTVSEERYYKLYAEMPPEMKIIRCCFTNAERVPHLPRDLFRNPLLDQYAAEGRWVGTYDVPLNINGNVETPEFKTPMRSAQRIKDYVSQLDQRGWELAAGMMAFGHYAREICGFNISAMAEYAWNVDGRSTKDFARAWATVNGFKQPERVSEWAELMGPVEWDIYDSNYPICYSWGQFTQLIRERRRPVLGEHVFRYYTTSESFDEKITACQAALKLAGEIEDPSFADETRVALTYAQLTHAIWKIAELISTTDVPTSESQAALRANVAELEKAGADNVAAITAWRTRYSPDTPQQPWHERVHDAMKGTETTVKDISELCKYQYLFY